MEAGDGPLAAPQEDLQYGALPDGKRVRPEGRIVTGFYMPATATSAVLPALAASRLTSGQRYLLQVQALDGSGNPVAESRRAGGLLAVNLPQAADRPKPAEADIDGEALLRRIAAGEEAAMAEFYKTYENPLYRFILSRLNDPFEAADILNEVMLEVWRGAGRFQGRSTVKSWIFGIARHKTLDRLRSRQRNAARAGEEPSEDIPDDRRGGSRRGHRRHTECRVREALPGTNVGGPPRSPAPDLLRGPDLRADRRDRRLPRRDGEDAHVPCQTRDAALPGEADGAEGVGHGRGRSRQGR